MPTEPRITDFPRIRATLAVYRVLAYATGIMLLVLVAEIVLKYGFGLEADLGGAGGFLALVPVDAHTGFNASLGAQITHGYFYLAYLISDFVLVTFLRWPITRFLLIAAGGVVPFLSFFTEHRITREVKDYLAAREARDRTPVATEAPHQR
jgi:integral membrane protein